MWAPQSRQPPATAGTYASDPRNDQLSGQQSVAARTERSPTGEQTTENAMADLVVTAESATPTPNANPETHGCRPAAGSTRLPRCGEARAVGFQVSSSASYYECKSLRAQVTSSASHFE
jgi:hypothetical protein